MPVSNHQNWLHHLRRGITDLWFILSVFIAVALLVILIDYHSTDPGWSASGVGETQHILGTAGAYAADTLLSLFGYTSYLIPAGVFMMGWQSVRRAHLDAELMAWKCFSLLVSLAALCGIFSLHWPVVINSLALTGGGMLGQKLSIELLNLWPLRVVMAIYGLFLLLGLTILLEIRWLTIFERIGKFSLRLFTRIGGLFDRPDKSSIPDKATAAARREEIKDRVDVDMSEATAIPLNWHDYKERNEDADGPFSDPADSRYKDSIEDEPDWFSQNSSEDHEPRFHFEGLDEDGTDNRDESLTSTPWVDDQDKNNQDDLIETIMPWCSEHTESDNLNESVDTQQHHCGAAFELTQPQVEELPQDDSQTENSRLKVNVSAALSDRSGHNGVSHEDYTLPGFNLLTPAPVRHQEYSEEELEVMKQNVEEALRNYRLDVHVVNVAVGPVVTRLELDLAPGIKVSQVSNLDKDIARSLAVPSVRVVEVIPGKPYIGLEIPNKKRDIVHLRGILESTAYRSQTSPLTLVLGGDIAGQPVVANLGKMPHLLVAGTTGSGKSVGINVMLTSMLYKARPDELKLILIDPKMLEMSMYEDIPHLLTPVVTDMNDAENALRWAVAEMERRYQLMAAMKVRSIDGFNRLLKEKLDAGERVDDPLWRAEDHLGIAHQPPQLEPLPYIVIVIDELADMMMAVGKKVEELIARIAQKARAAGIHLILATQRPSVDVITGLIKANVPTRISFQVSSKIDSRTIIDQQGAEALLGHGDMLFVPPGSAAPQRVHGAYIDDQEVDRVTSFVKSQGEPNYESAIVSPVAPQDMGAFGASEKSDDPEQDPLYDEAVAMVIEHGKASISWLQRRLSIGYNRSARLIEAMEQAGIVSPPDRGARKVLVAKPENHNDF